MPMISSRVLDPPVPSVDIRDIRLPQQDEDEPALGRGFEVELGKFWFNPETEKWVRWILVPYRSLRCRHPYYGVAFAPNPEISANHGFVWVKQLIAHLGAKKRHWSGGIQIPLTKKQSHLGRVSLSPTSQAL